jgi:hypothetical protein
MKKKGRHITAVWQYGGFRLNLKLVLYLQSQCLTESLGFLNPPHRQAAGRYKQAYPNATSDTKTINKIFVNSQTDI